ncbi:MAG: hypothetical protein ABR591_15230 [Candidatus Velthaea sp.]
MDVGMQGAGSPATAAPPVSAAPIIDPGVSAQHEPAGLPAPPPAREANLHETIAHVFGGGSGQRNVEVNLRVAKHPDEIIAVFRDATTGEVISQVPTETIVRLAEFFEQEASGALFDRNV